MTEESMVLTALAEHDERINQYEFDPGNEMGQHWLHLKYPFVCNGNSSIHESTVAACLQEYRHITK